VLKNDVYTLPFFYIMHGVIARHPLLSVHLQKSGAPHVRALCIATSCRVSEARLQLRGVLVSVVPELVVLEAALQLALQRAALLLLVWSLRSLGHRQVWVTRGHDAHQYVCTASSPVYQGCMYRKPVVAHEDCYHEHDSTWCVRPLGQEHYEVVHVITCTSAAATRLCVLCWLFTIQGRWLRNYLSHAIEMLSRPPQDMRSMGEWFWLYTNFLPTQLPHVSAVAVAHTFLASIG
jgi:hypothetical protein